MKKFILVIALISALLSGCKKGWLDEKRDIQLIVPITLTDLRLLLNNGLTLPMDYQGIAELSAGDFSITTDFWKTQSQDVRAAYTWTGLFRGTPIVNEWDGSYKQIEICNVILDALAKLSPTSGDTQERDDIKGIALFLRARAFYNVATVFSLPYNLGNLQKPGIHLRLSSDINTAVNRATIAQTYQKIINDLLDAIPLVKENSINKDNPSRAAVYGLLAKVYLIMGNYEKAESYASSCLKQPVALLNYSSLKATDTYPFKRNNEEVIINSTIGGNYGPFYAPNGKIDPQLIKSYSDNDLRKTLFFVLNSADKTYSFRGMYLGLRGIFSGIATDEIYLIKAECLARMENTDGSMKVLNDLLITRFKPGTYAKLSAGSSAEALSIILKERRKELILRGIRWSDLKRLNNDSATAITLTRNVDGKDYRLDPNDQRYAFPLPDYVVTTYHLEQNLGW